MLADRPTFSPDQTISDHLKARVTEVVFAGSVTLLSVNGHDPREYSAMRSAGVKLDDPRYVKATVNGHTVEIDLKASYHWCSDCPAYEHSRLCYHVISAWVVASL